MTAGSTLLGEPIWWFMLVLPVLLPCVVPALFSRSTWQLRWPRVALGGWLLMFLLGCASMAISLIRLLVHVTTQAARGVPSASVAMTIMAWVALGGVGALVAYVWSAAEPLNSEQQREIGGVAPLATARYRYGRYTVVHFDSEVVAAFAGGAWGREVYLSSGIRRRLSATHLQGVIEHEVAHLRQRHGLIVRLAEINAACLPRKLQVGRKFKRAALLLVELIADDTAARKVGPARYANTLLIMARMTGDEGFLFRALRLETQDFRRSSVRRAWRLLVAS